MRIKRIVRILALPVLAFIFVIGWIMYVLGDSAKYSKKSTKQNAHKKEPAPTEADDLEIGVIEQPTETIIEKKRSR